MMKTKTQLIFEILYLQSIMKWADDYSHSSMQHALECSKELNTVCLDQHQVWAKVLLYRNALGKMHRIVEFDQHNLTFWLRFQTHPFVQTVTLVQRKIIWIGRESLKRPGSTKNKLFWIPLSGLHTFFFQPTVCTSLNYYTFDKTWIGFVKIYHRYLNLIKYT